MSYRRGWVLLVGLAWAAGARAQPGVLSPDASISCGAIDEQVCANDVECGSLGLCRNFGDHGSHCVPRAAIFCCSEDADCPSRITGEVTHLCRSVDGLSGGSGLCLPLETYCGELSIERVRACHTLESGQLTPRFDDGDCDGDGLSNGTERNLSTDACAAPAPIGTGTTTCVDLTGECTLGEACANTPSGAPATCTTTPDGAGTFCDPGPGVLYCCGDDGFECPQRTDRCVPTPVGTRCVSRDCAAFRDIDPLACITTAEGMLVPYPQGDCDRDGTANGGDLTQCGDGVMIDAGALPGEDAGIEPAIDGGAQDGGRIVIQPRFEGGGGCACGAARGSRTAPVLVVIGALFFAWRRRR